MRQSYNIGYNLKNFSTYANKGMNQVSGNCSRCVIICSNYPIFVANLV